MCLSYFKVNCSHEPVSHIWRCLNMNTVPPRHFCNIYSKASKKPPRNSVKPFSRIYTFFRCSRCFQSQIFNAIFRFSSFPEVIKNGLVILSHRAKVAARRYSLCLFLYFCGTCTFCHQDHGNWPPWECKLLTSVKHHGWLCSVLRVEFANQLSQS